MEYSTNPASEPPIKSTAKPPLATESLTKYTNEMEWDYTLRFVLANLRVDPNGPIYAAVAQRFNLDQGIRDLLRSDKSASKFLKSTLPQAAQGFIVLTPFAWKPLHHTGPPVWKLEYKLRLLFRFLPCKLTD